MPTIVVPFRGPGGKQRLAPLPEPARAALAEAMLADVLAAACVVGPTIVVAPEDALWAATSAGATEVVPDPGAGQGAAVGAGLDRVGDGPVLILNADVPCATQGDLEALLAALPAGGIALVEAADGTTNALALASPRLFQPLYGAGSAARFRALDVAAVRTLAIANLMDDVDTLDDLHRLGSRLGPNTLRTHQLFARAGAAA
jgi:2-phospho-L-lactate guanylyltransferase